MNGKLTSTTATAVQTAATETQVDLSLGGVPLQPGGFVDGDHGDRVDLGSSALDLRA